MTTCAREGLVDSPVHIAPAVKAVLFGLGRAEAAGGLDSIGLDLRVGHEALVVDCGLALRLDFPLVSVRLHESPFAARRAKSRQPHLETFAHRESSACT